jgi:hypothetical protein
MRWTSVFTYGWRLSSVRMHASHFTNSSDLIALLRTRSPHRGTLDPRRGQWSQTLVCGARNPF